MHNYQFGKHLTFGEVLKNKSMYAEIFSEGNSSLKNLLLNLWNQELETYMCCTGHEMGDAAYIMIYVPINDMEMIYRIVNSVYDMDGVTTRLGKEHNNGKLLIDIKSYTNNEFFKKVNDSLNNKTAIIKENQELVNVVEALIGFENKNYDLYFEISNYGSNKKFYSYANFIRETADGPIRSMYVLDKLFLKEELLECREIFGDRDLLEIEKKYQETKVLTKKIVR